MAIISVCFIISKKNIANYFNVTYTRKHKGTKMDFCV